MKFKYLVFLFFTISLLGFVSEDDTRKKPDFISIENEWVDSVYNSFSDDEKIAQLFMVAAYSNRSEKHKEYISHLINDYKIGGLIFFQGGPIRQADLVNYYQQITKTPLLIGMDAEWGIGMRLDSSISYPRQMMLGAIQNDSLLYKLGVSVAEQSAQIGVQVNFAPVVDVNVNPNNPVINSRSFGEDKTNVARKGLMYMKGMQDNNLLTSAKHFPGHGDTGSDSHYTLPIIKHNKKRLSKVEFYPFKHLIKNGLNGIMIAHLFIPALDNRKGRASTLSSNIVNDLLVKKLKFDGLIYTDALNMKGVVNYYAPGKIEVEAIKAGNDVLLFPQNVEIAMKSIKNAINSGEISMARIEHSCKKIIKAKYWAGCNKNLQINTQNLVRKLNAPKYQLLKRKLIENAITVIENKNQRIPLLKLDTLLIAHISIGGDKANRFSQTIKKYTKTDLFVIHRDAVVSDFEALFEKTKKYNLIIIDITNTNEKPSKLFGVTQNSIDFVNKIAINKKVVLDIFANPYSLKYFNTNNLESIIMSYQDDDVIQDLSAQLIFGGISATGRLPITASSNCAIYTGVDTKKKIRLKYSIPVEVGVNEEKLLKIDSLANAAVLDSATPGCQIFCAKNGIVFYNKSFGYKTYKKQSRINSSNIYDLASITKIAATTLALMKLSDDRVFDSHSLLSDYLCELDTTNKRTISIEDVLTHQSGLPAWIPFYKATISSDSIRDIIYSINYDSLHSLQVADSLYILNSYRDSIYKILLDTALLEKKEYLYSDLGYYFFKKIINKNINIDYEYWLRKNFYLPLGASNIIFNPNNKVDSSLIVPTQLDTIFRKQMINGYVHDPGAAMLDGIAGHAGLFASANDLGKLMQMLVQYGQYGGKKYIDSTTVKYFTSCRFCDQGNRRGLGFDKPEPDPQKEGPCFKGISLNSFGHSGFTGTLVWADPDTQIVYVFLSNRIHPNQSNYKLVEGNYRTEILKAFYQLF